MKLQFHAILILSFLLLISCDNEEVESQWVDVTVISEAVDCRENWIIRYENPVPEEGLERFQEIGLPSEYKIEDLELRLKIRDPRNEEMFPCTTAGISYPFKIILEAKRS